MFTGIIEATGAIAAIETTGGDARLRVESTQLDFSDVKLGDSIASNGICLTVVEVWNAGYAADVSRETIAKSAIRHWRVGDTVNLEKAMLPSSRFGGHIVAGHVDGVGAIVKRQNDARSLYIEVKIPPELLRYTADKGSVAVDGVSLTTNAVCDADATLRLNIIPHSAERTNIHRHWRVGAAVNIEVDLLARYTERLLGRGEPASLHSSRLSEEFLIASGFGRGR